MWLIDLLLYICSSENISEPQVLLRCIRGDSNHVTTSTEAVLLSKSRLRY